MRSSLVPLALLVSAVVATVTGRSAPYFREHTPASGATAPDVKYRLNLEGIEPIHYDIYLKPIFPELQTFKGKVTITVDIAENVTEIKLHAAENIDIEPEKIMITKVNETISDNRVNYTVDPDYDFLILELEPAPSENGRYNIYIEYEGKFATDMYGFYKSTYTVKDENGTDTSRVLLATQFQPTHARKAFPCFDEPKYKAKYDVTIEVPEGYGVLGNEEVTGENAGGENDDGTKSHTFSVDTKMSTYLLAFLIYEEDSYSETNIAIGNGKTPFRTFARTVELQGGEGGNANLSQEISPKILEEFEKYTNITYDFSKVDQAAIPDFAAGAMENWGLITYRETALLFNPDENTEAARRRVVEIIAHELAHQWFGNLVTTEWWGATWLNEGFATFFEYSIVHEIYPEWRMLERLVVDEQQYAFATDALESSKPLTDDTVNSPAEVMARFSTISYSKGGSILRMIEDALGKDKFKSKIAVYLEEKKEDYVVPSDLFHALGEGSLNETFFKSWTEVPGYPLINVERNGEGKLVISQKRFMLDNSPRNEIYYVPLRINVNGVDENDIFWLREKSSDWTNNVEENSLILVNNTGYFRVNYTEENWGRLGETIQSLEPLQRATLLDDALNIARGHQLSYNVTLKLVGKLKKETDFIPWSAAFSGLAHLYRRLLHEDEDKTFDKFVLEIVGTVYDELGFDSDEPGNKDRNVRAAHRTNVLTWACRSGHEECIEKAVEMLKDYVDENKKIDPDLRSVVYCYGVKHGGERLWNTLWNKMKSTTDAAERAVLIPALACINSVSTLHMYLEQSIAGHYIRSQDASSVFSAVYTNPNGVDVALDFLVDEIQAIAKSYTSMNALPNIINGIAQYLHSDEQIAKLEKLLDDGAVKDDVQQAINSVRANQKWVEEKKTDVLDAMKCELGGCDDNGGNGSGATVTVLVIALATALLAHY